MRQIGTLPRTADPKVLVDYLLSQGVTSRAVESGDGWAIWVHNEDHVPAARESFAAYEQDTDDPRFADASRAAREERVKAAKVNREYRKNVRDVSETWNRLNLHRRPLTAFLVAVCVGVYVVQGLSGKADRWLDENFFFFPLSLTAHRLDLSHSLDAIHRGEVWRLITPIFLHIGLVHLVFNVWATWILGTVIETRRGTLMLLGLTLVSAVGSNILQYLFMLNFAHELIPWAGISGVGYAMFGYLWMKGLVRPRAGHGLAPELRPDHAPLAPPRVHRHPAHGQRRAPRRHARGDVVRAGPVLIGSEQN